MKARSIPQLTVLSGLVLSLGISSGCAADSERVSGGTAKPETKEQPRQPAQARDAAPQAVRPGVELDRLRQQLREAEESGRKEQAAEIRERIAMMEGQVAARNDRRDNPEARLRLQRQIDELQQAGRHDEAQRLERELNAMRNPQRDRPVERAERPQGDQPERMQHVREAIGHLHAAGMHDLANRLEQETDRRRPGMEGPGPRPLSGAPGRVMAQPPRAEMAELQANMGELREQMRQMQRALEEIRQSASRSAPERR